MFLWYPVMDLVRAPHRTARKKGSGYENGQFANFARPSRFSPLPSLQIIQLYPGQPANLVDFPLK
jgi:hypothetical protein